MKFALNSHVLSKNEYMGLMSVNSVLLAPIITRQLHAERMILYHGKHHIVLNVKQENTQTGQCPQSMNASSVPLEVVRTALVPVAVQRVVLVPSNPFEDKLHAMIVKLVDTVFRWIPVEVALHHVIPVLITTRQAKMRHLRVSPVR